MKPQRIVLILLQFVIIPVIEGKRVLSIVLVMVLVVLLGKATGLLLMFSVIAKIPEAIKAGRNIKVQKGDSSVEISTKEPNE